MIAFAVKVAQDMKYVCGWGTKLLITCGRTMLLSDDLLLLTFPSRFCFISLSAFSSRDLRAFFAVTCNCKV